MSRPSALHWGLGPLHGGRNCREPRPEHGPHEDSVAVELCSILYKDPSAPSPRRLVPATALLRAERLGKPRLCA